MIRNLFLYFFLFLSAGLLAQDVVLEKNVDEQYQEKKGPNMRYYGHFYEGIGTVAPYGNLKGATAESQRSSEIIFGYRYKIKLLSFYAIGLDLSNRWLRYGIKSEGIPVAGEIASNPLSEAGLVDKLSLNLSSLGLEAYNRINIGKRGNVLGNFIDIGIKGEWNYGSRLILKSDATDGDYFQKAREVRKKLDFIGKLSTLVTARIGINKIGIYGNYRLSDLIADGYTTPELPPLTVGVQVAF
jgi:hypothetical protein